MGKEPISDGVVEGYCKILCHISNYIVKAQTVLSNIPRDWDR